MVAPSLPQSAATQDSLHSLFLFLQTNAQHFAGMIAGEDWHGWPSRAHSLLLPSLGTSSITVNEASRPGPLVMSPPVKWCQVDPRLAS